MSKLNFPLPYPGQLPNNDLAAARSMLNVIASRMEVNADLGKRDVLDLLSVLFEVMEKLEVIQFFLDDCECPDVEQQYQAARRAWVMQYGGAE